MKRTCCLLLLAASSAASAQAPDARAPQPAPPKAAISVAELEGLTARSPADPKVWVVLGLAYWDRGEYPRALKAFERAVEVGPASAEAHNWLGVALSEKADLPGAIAAFRKAVALDPEYGRAHTNLGSALAQSGDYAQAVQAFERALALEPNALGAQMNLGVALREIGDFDGALRHLRRVAAADATNANLHYELGQTLRQNGDLAGAVGAFERALELDPELREAYYALGAALKQQAAAMPRPAAPPSPADDRYRGAQDALARGDLAAARQQLDEALRADPNHAGAHTLLGFALGQQGELPSGLAHLERAVALRPDSADAHYHLGVALWYGGSKDKSLLHLRKSVTLDPAGGPAHAFLGTALREQGDTAGARISLQRALALLPSTAAVYIDLGVTFLRDNQIERALGQFEAGLNLPSGPPPTPDWPRAIASLRAALPAADADRRAEAQNILGLLLGRNGASSSEVAAAFREAVRLRPDFAHAHNNLGLVLIQSGDDPGGIAAFREATRLDPNYAEARANLGAALTPTDPAAAVRELEQAVALAPTAVTALFNLAMAYGSSARHGTPLQVDRLRKVIELAPAFPRAHLALGKALLQEGKVPDAVAALREAARLEPANGEARYQLGLALARAGQKDEAATELQKGRELVAAGDRAQNASFEVLEGRAALERGELDEAAAKFRRALQLRPDLADAHQHLASVHEKKGDTQAAIGAYRKALELNPGALDARRALDRLAAGVSGTDDPQKIAEVESYIREKRFKEVEPLLAAYVKEHAQSSWGWYALGYSYFGQQKIGDSIRALAKSLELDVRNAEAHKILGRTLMIIGRFDAARLEFEQALRYKPDSAEAYYNLGRLHSIQDNWGPARQAFEGALRIDPEYLESLDGLGFALEALGQDEAALAMYRRASALNDERKGTFASPHVNLSAYYNRTGDPEQALEHARKALTLDASSDRALFQKGRAHERLEQLEEAVQALNDAIVLNPRASSYYYVLAGVYRRLGWTEESRKALDVFKRLERESSELDKKRRGAAGSVQPSKLPGSARD